MAILEVRGRLMIEKNLLMLKSNYFATLYSSRFAEKEAEVGVLEIIEDDFHIQEPDVLSESRVAPHLSDDEFQDLKAMASYYGVFFPDSIHKRQFNFFYLKLRDLNPYLATVIGYK